MYLVLPAKIADLEALMGFSKITTLSLTELFVQQIENMILSGELQVGERLPAARDLCVKMDVSRPVISAGLVELEKMGFVEIQPRQGVFVSDYRRRGTMETLVAIMRYNGGALRKNEVRSLLETREAMECLCLRLAIERASDAELETLEPILESIRTTTDSDEAAELAFRFHHELAVLSGNVLMPLMYYSFRPQSVYLWGLYCKRCGSVPLYEIKLRLYRALLNRDTEEVLSQTHEVLSRAIAELSFYGA
jgi:GntR family transcriptional regulator, transcriptional repressor for pyruvate dehydrogenase complex